MGMHFKDIKYFEEVLGWLEYKKYIDGCNELRLCEIGDLWIRKDAHEYTSNRLASEYFEGKGFEVEVIDLGIGTDSISESEKRMNKSILRYDLSKPIYIDKLNRFNFVVDFGTAEHVENQYEFNKNIHNLCEKGGIIIRSNPSDKYSGGAPSKHHGLFHYTPIFYTKLASLCGYEIIDIREMAQRYGVKTPYRKNFTYVTMVKKMDNEFLSTHEFNEVAVELGYYKK